MGYKIIGYLHSYIIQMHDSFKAIMPLIIPEGVLHYSKSDDLLDIFLE
jgi:hypothetical protein